MPPQNINATDSSTESAKPTTGAIFSNTPGMPGIFKSNFDYQVVRAMSTGAYGDGGAVGEIFSTARQIKDGDIEGWTKAWKSTAKRMENIAQDCLRRGHIISARGVSASLYLLENGSVLPPRQRSPTT
jgi:hypothetical protein